METSIWAWIGLTVGPVVGLGVLLLVAALRRRCRGRRVRQAMGKITRLEAAPSESFGVLRGRLRRPGGGDGVAVASVVTGHGFHGPASACCTGLELETQGERVRLEGAAEVILGSRETSASSMLYRTDETSYRRVADRFPDLVQSLVTPRAALKLVELDDEVVLAGRLERVGHPDSQAGYRQSAHRWVLNGGRGPAIVAAVRPSRPRLSCYALLLGLGALVPLTLLWLWASQVDRGPWCLMIADDSVCIRVKC